MRPVDPRLLRAVPETRAVLVGLGALGVVAGLLAVAQAVAVAALVVAVVRSADTPDPGLTSTATILAVVLLARIGVAMATERRAARAGVHVCARLRSRLVDRWLERPCDRRPEPATAATLAAQGIASVEAYVARFLPALVAAVALPVFVVVAMGLLDSISALVVVATVPLLPIFAALIGAATERRTQRRWRALSAIAGHFLDVVQGLPVLVAYGRADRQTATIEQVSERHRRATVSTLRLAFLSAAALELLASVSVAIVAVTVGLRLSSGALDLHTGLTVILLAPEAYWPIRRVGAEYHAAVDGLVALTQVLDELTDPEPHRTGRAQPAPAVAPGDPAAAPVDPAAAPVDPAAAPGEPALGVRRAAYRYPGADADTLSGIDLVCTGPGLVVLTGPSGVGKSTLLELLAGIRTPTSGSVTTPATHLVAQRPLLVAGSIRDNLVLGLPTDPSPDEIAGALALVGLADVVATLPAGLATHLGDGGFGLSAGQRARLTIARALLCPAPLVLFDEPTSHLDEATALVVHRAIAWLARTRLVVVATHRPDLAATATRRLDLGSSVVEAVR